MNDGTVCEQRNELRREPTPCVGEDRLNKLRPINIEELNHGYVVRVGCHTFAIENKSQLIVQLSAYIQEPALTEKKWFDGKLF